MPVDTAPELQFGVSGEEPTELALATRLVKYLDLAEALARRVRIKRRRHGCRDNQMLMPLIYFQCEGGGNLSEVDAVRAGSAVHRGQGGPRCRTAVWAGPPVSGPARRQRSVVGNA